MPSFTMLMLKESCWHPNGLSFYRLDDDGRELIRSPGGAIAHTVINGPMDLSGEYLQWDDERLAPSSV